MTQEAESLITLIILIWTAGVITLAVLLALANYWSKE
jgi:hypothetical protein